MPKLNQRWAIRLAFALMGAAFGLWTVRIYEFKTDAGLTHFQLGLYMLLAPLALQVCMWQIPRITRLFGVRRMIPIGMVIICFVFLGLSLTPPSIFIILLFLLLGVGVVFIEIGLNTVAQKIDREDRPIVLSAHGWWSLGFMFGSVIGGWLGQIGVNFTTQQLLMTPLLLVLTWVAVTPLPQPRPSSANQKHAFPSWAILPICLMPFAALFTEGAISEWGSIFLSEERGAAPIEIGLLSGAFMGGMAVTRLSGDWFRKFYSARFLIVVSVLIMCVGLGLYSLVPALDVIALGAFICGCGVGMVYPLVLVLANENRDEDEASGIIASIASISFLSFLISPPLVGFIAETTSLSFAFALLVPLGLSTYIWLWLTRRA